MTLQYLHSYVIIIQSRMAMSSFRQHFVCSICHEMMDEASFIEECGHDFCEHCITYWLELNSTCPVCRKVTMGGLKPSVLVRKIVTKLRSRHRIDNPADSLLSTVTDDQMTEIVKEEVHLVYMKIIRNLSSTTAHQRL
jgi:hypothetical protein